MKFTPKSIRKHQQGGPVGPAEGAMPDEGAMPQEEMPQEGGQQENPLMALAQGAAQALQSQDCQIALQVCEGLIGLVQQMAGPAPQEQAGEPVFRKGGILTRRIQK